MNKPRSNVAENQRVIILTGLVTIKARIGVAGWVELVLPNVSCSSRESEEESLNGDDINGINRGITIYVAGRQPTPRQGSAEMKEVPLDGNHIHRIDPRGARRQRSLCGGHDIASP